MGTVEENMSLQDHEQGAAPLEEQVETGLHGTASMPQVPDGPEGPKGCWTHITAF